MRLWSKATLPLLTFVVACDSSETSLDASAGDAAVTLDASRADATAQPDATVTEDGGVPADGGLNTDGGTVPGDEVVTCPSGQELVFYSWTPLSPVPALAELEFSGYPKGTMLVSAGNGETMGVRFDICRESNGAHHLHGVLWANSDFGWPYYFYRDETATELVFDMAEYRGGNLFQMRVPAADFRTTGLDEALAGDLDNFELRSLGEPGLLILGHPNFLAGIISKITANSIEYQNLEMIAGGLAAGDIFTAKVCPFGQRPYSKTFNLSTAEFSMDACTFLDAGHTTGYVLHKLTVTDTNAELSAAEQQTFTFDGPAAVEAVLNYKWNHHNACDSFHLALPHGDYAASASPLAGCGTTVPNAPERSFDEDQSIPTKYRIRYHGGAWVDGLMTGCNHYLFCQQ